MRLMHLDLMYEGKKKNLGWTKKLSFEICFWLDSLGLKYLGGILICSQMVWNSPILWQRSQVRRLLGHWDIILFSFTAEYDYAQGSNWLRWIKQTNLISSDSLHSSHWQPSALPGHKKETFGNCLLDSW